MPFKTTAPGQTLSSLPSEATRHHWVDILQQYAQRHLHSKEENYAPHHPFLCHRIPQDTSSPLLSNRQRIRAPAPTPCPAHTKVQNSYGPNAFRLAIHTCSLQVAGGFLRSVSNIYDIYNTSPTPIMSHKMGTSASSTQPGVLRRFAQFVTKRGWMTRHGVQRPMLTPTRASSAVPASCSQMQMPRPHIL